MFGILPRYEINQPIRSLPDVPDLLPHPVEQQLTLILTASCKPHPLNHPAAHAAYEQLSFPGRESIARVEEDVGNSNRRHPEKPRGLHPLSYRRFADDFARVFASVADNGPSIV